MAAIDVSAVVNAHREGLLVGPTLRSVDLAVTNARQSGIRVEVICVLDKPDDLTRNIFSDWAAKRSDAALVEVDFGDLGLARNSGVTVARGEWIAFVDADDLWGSNWLSEAFRAAEAEPRPTVWHPEASLYFGVRPHIFIHVDMDDPSFTLSILALTNPWTALCFAKRSLLLDIPYRQADHARQLGYEDWGWYIDTIEKDWLHKIVPGTAHAIRTKAVSLNLTTGAASCLPHKTDLFRSALGKRQRERAEL